MKHLQLHGSSPALLTDLYQLTMAYGYWKTGADTKEAVFNLYFRENPFQGGYCISSGLEYCTDILSEVRFDPDDIEYLRIFLEFLKSYDIVQGVRRKPIVGVDKQLKPVILLLRLFGIKHLTKRSDTIFKSVVSVINYILIRVFFDVPLSDFQNITFYRTEFIQSIEYEAKSSFANPEPLIKAYWQKKSINFCSFFLSMSSII